MQKNELLNQIKDLAANNLLSKEEVISAYESGISGKEIVPAESKELDFIRVLYYIGGLIVVLGIVILVYQNWNKLGPGARVLITLGSSIAAYVVGVLFNTNKKTEEVGLAFHLISAFVMPIGIYILFENLGYNIRTDGFYCLLSGLLFTVYLASYLLFKRNFFLLFAIIFGTWLFFAATDMMVRKDGFYNYYNDFFKYRTLLTGLSYILLGYSFVADEFKKALSGPLYGFGIFGLLGASLWMGGWKPQQNIFWELIFPVMVFTTLFLSTQLKIKSFLSFGTIFLILFICKITGEYFTDSMGWPFALVLAGFALIAVGYLFFYLDKKYLSPRRI